MMHSSFLTVVGRGAVERPVRAMAVVPAGKWLEFRAHLLASHRDQGRSRAWIRRTAGLSCFQGTTRAGPEKVQTGKGVRNRFLTERAGLSRAWTWEDRNEQPMGDWFTTLRTVPTRG